MDLFATSPDYGPTATSAVNIRVFRLGVMYAAALLLCLPGLTGVRVVSAPLPAVVANSPTGRNPKLAWTPERQAVWARMKADYEADSRSPSTAGGRWYQVLKRNAECGCRYGDTGLWATIMYQITGGQQYPPLAWAKISQGFLALQSRELGGNFARESSAELVLQYDWLYPALSDGQRRTFLAKLNEMMTIVVNGNTSSSPAMPVRTTDTDQTVGSYFGLVFLYLATADHNPTAGDLFSRPFVGGLDPTAMNRATLRNAIQQYVTQLAAGGEWMESSDYNLGTVRLLAIGAEGARTATGTDHFPEVTRFLRQAALRPIYFLTPDRQDSVQWGDEQHPRNLTGRVFAWQTTNGVLSGLTQDDSQSGPFVQQLVDDLAGQYAPSGNSSEPYARFFLFFNPYAPRSDFRELPRVWYAPGQGFLLARDDWTPASTLISVHMPQKQIPVDHEVRYFGDFQIYRRNEWAVTHPIAYSGPTLDGEGTNAMIIGGFSSMPEFKRVTAQENGPDGDTYITGTTGGQPVEEGYYNPPPTFLHEWTRSVLYLPSIDKRSDTLVVYDRTNAQSPLSLANLQGYRSPQQNAILQMAGLKQWVIHMPVEPAIGADSLRWTTPKGQQIIVSTLLPAKQRRIVMRENALWSGTTMLATERHWQVRIIPSDEQLWDTFLNVIQASDSSTNLSNGLLRSIGGEAEGVIVRRPGHSDAVVMFNAQQGPQLPTRRAGRVAAYDPAVDATLSAVRQRSTGYVVRVPSQSARTNVILADLNPEYTWRFSVDTNPLARLSVSRQGVGRLQLTGATSHTLRLTASQG